MKNMTRTIDDEIEDFTAPPRTFSCDAAEILTAPNCLGNHNMMSYQALAKKEEKKYFVWNDVVYETKSCSVVIKTKKMTFKASGIV